MRLRYFYSVFTLFYLTLALDQVSEIRGLRGEADYRHITIKWEYPRYGVPVYGFQIHYCELQAWGPNRCKTKVIERSGDVKDNKEKDELTYAVIISDLRMATNYSFTVRPMETRKTRYLVDKAAHNTIIVSTKGFSARAILCLPDASEVEVSTGPFFSGRIAVEGAVGPECGLEGDPNSTRDTYILRISHVTCGSSTNSSAVATFILVQENLPILTHSTRRFLVVCTFHPETLTVRAGLNLPHTSHGSVEPQGDTESEMIEMSGNDVHASPLQQDSNSGRAFSEETEAQMVVTVIAFLVSIVGLSLAVWWYFPSRNRSESESILSEESSSSMYENLENSIRDGELNEEDRAMGGVCNSVMKESGMFSTGAKHNCITIETQTASEA